MPQNFLEWDTNCYGEKILVFRDLIIPNDNASIAKNHFLLFTYTRHKVEVKHSNLGDFSKALLPNLRFLRCFHKRILHILIEILSQAFIYQQRRERVISSYLLLCKVGLRATRILFPIMRFYLFLLAHISLHPYINF